jgi:hypothetical protein
MGVVIEICVKHPGGPTRIKVNDITSTVTPERTLVSVGEWPLHISGLDSFSTPLPT